MFGVKVKNIKTKGTYTIEELFEAIKDKKFSAGEPSLTKHGPSTIITFPPLDRKNQVWVMRAGFKAESQKFSVQKGEQAGIGNMAVNMVLEDVTDGLFSLAGAVGSNVKRCEELVELTAKELDALNL